MSRKLRKVVLGGLVAGFILSTSVICYAYEVIGICGECGGEIRPDRTHVCRYI